MYICFKFEWQTFMLNAACLPVCTYWLAGCLCVCVNRRYFQCVRVIVFVFVLFSWWECGNILYGSIMKCSHSANQIIVWLNGCARVCLLCVRCGWMDVWVSEWVCLCGICGTASSTSSRMFCSSSSSTTSPLSSPVVVVPNVHFIALVAVGG